jgi:hypothetical protein
MHFLERSIMQTFRQWFVPVRRFDGVELGYAQSPKAGAHNQSVQSSFILLLISLSHPDFILSINHRFPLRLEDP